MSSGVEHSEELDYLIRYAQMTPLYFVPLRDAAEKVAGKDSTEGEVQAVTLKLIGDMIDNGVKVGDMSPKEGEGVIPWRQSKDEVIRRVADAMKQHSDPIDFIDIAWFST